MASRVAQRVVVFIPHTPERPHFVNRLSQLSGGPPAAGRFILTCTSASLCPCLQRRDAGAAERRAPRGAHPAERGAAGKREEPQVPPGAPSLVVWPELEKRAPHFFCVMLLVGRLGNEKNLKFLRVRAGL